jgi:hypothetical protein
MLEQLLLSVMQKVLKQHLKQQMLLLTSVLQQVAVQKHQHWRLEKLLSAVLWHVTMRQQQDWYFEGLLEAVMWQNHHWMHIARHIENVWPAMRKHVKMQSQQRSQLEKPQSAVMPQDVVLYQQLL